jgi:organic hydroperoxide reductase OsmC/OhrA
MSNNHQYKVCVNWQGNRGTGTSKYDEYDRTHTVQADGKQLIQCSSDAPFRGDIQYYNPEDMLVASLSACHMLWYLHVCADAGIIVMEYTDHAEGTLSLIPNGISKFTEVILHPTVVVQHETMIAKAIELHHVAHQKCFIANSCNFEIKHLPIISSK